MEQGRERTLTESMIMMSIMIWAIQMVVILAQSLVGLASIPTLAGLEQEEKGPGQVRLLFFVLCIQLSC